MKENTEVASDLIFTHCPSRYTKGNPLSSCISSLIKQALALKDQLQSGAAVLGIAACFLAITYLFLAQLAEYGWW